jgi:hypothetical protein
MDDHDEVEALRREVRRLKAQVFTPEEEKEDLHRRYVFVCQELERTRAKIPPSKIRTS